MKHLTFVALVTISCVYVYGCEGMTGSNSVDKDNPENRKPKMMTLYTDLDEEKRLQQAVDNGGQTWRLNPVDVAHASMVSQGVNVRIEDCELIKEDGSHAIVEIHSKAGDFNVHADRLGRSDGIWTATQIEIMSNLDTHKSEHEHGLDHNHHH